MGCYDILCPFCNLPYQYGLTISKPKNKKELDQFEDYLNYLRNKYKILKKMNDNEIIKFTKELEKKTKWMSKAIILLKDGNVIKNVVETSCNSKFNDKYHNFPFGEVLWLHVDCYNYINKKLGFKISLKMIPYNLITPECYFNKSKNFTIKFLNQEFDYFSLLQKDKKFFDKPLKNNKKIQKLIDNNLKLINLNKNSKKLNTPMIKPSFLKDKSYMLGNDKQIYQIQNKKWIKKETKYGKISISKKDFNFNGIYKKDKKYKNYYLISEFIHNKNFKIIFRNTKINNNLIEIHYAYLS
jgi:hypothetical protein